MLRKNVKEILLLYFKATFDGVDNLSWVKKNFKKKVKMEIRRWGEQGGKEVDFQVGTYSLKTIKIEHVFTWYSQKYILRKTNLDFPNKIHTN